jgi:hypothetical protein
MEPAGFSPIKIVESEYSVFAFGTSARNQSEVKNMQNTKEMLERMRRIETWKYRVRNQELWTI